VVLIKKILDENHHPPQVTGVLSNEFPDVEPDDEEPVQQSSVAVVPDVAKRVREITSTPLKAPEEGEIVDSPNGEISFNDLL